MRADVVEALRGFPEKWRQRFPNERPPSARFVVDTFLSKFLSGDVPEKIATARLSNLEVAASGEHPGRVDFSFRATLDVVENLVRVVNEWNKDESRPALTQAWVFEAAFFAFTGNEDLISAVAETLTKALRAVAGGGQAPG